MITKQTAYDIWIAYDEIAKGEQLIKTLEEQRSNHEPMNLRDGFGRPRSFQLGIPSGESGHRLYDVQPMLALQVIRAHVATKQAELGVLNERAKAELEARQ